MANKSKKKAVKDRFPAAIRERIKHEAFGVPCDECPGTMQLKWSHLYGKFFYGCDLYPTCRFSYGATETGKPTPGIDGRPKPTSAKPGLSDKPCEYNKINPYTGHVTPCKGHLTVKWSHRRQNWFYGCTEWPNCRHTDDVRTLLWDLLQTPLESTTTKPRKSKKKKRKKNKQLEALQDETFLA